MRVDTVLAAVGGCADRLKGIMVRLRAVTGRNERRQASAALW